jgi:hypothetical protein
MEDEVGSPASSGSSENSVRKLTSTLLLSQLLLIVT